MNQMDQLAPLHCPKCRGPWRRVERNGLVIDQCEQCQGIFLDRGELEQLLGAERAYYDRAQPGGPSGYPAGGSSAAAPGGFLGSLFGGHQSGRRPGGHH